MKTLRHGEWEVGFVYDIERILNPGCPQRMGLYGQNPRGV